MVVYHKEKHSVQAIRHGNSTHGCLSLNTTQPQPGTSSSLCFVSSYQKLQIKSRMRNPARDVVHTTPNLRYISRRQKTIQTSLCHLQAEGLVKGFNRILEAITLKFMQGFSWNSHSRLVIFRLGGATGLHRVYPHLDTILKKKNLQGCTAPDNIKHCIISSGCSHCDPTHWFVDYCPEASNLAVAI